MKVNGPGSVRSVSKKLLFPCEVKLMVRKLRKVKSIFDLNAED